MDSIVTEGTGGSVQVTDAWRPCLVDTRGVFEFLAARFEGLSKLFELARIHPSITAASLPEGHRVYPNIGEHSVAVYLVALRISELLRAAGAISRSEFMLASKAALLHDAAKPLEIEGAGRELRAQFYSQLAVEGLTGWLESLRVGTEIAGHMGLSRLIEQAASEGFDLVRGLAVQKIVFLADACVSSLPPREGQVPRSYFCTPHERVRRSELASRYPVIASQGCGFDQQGRFGHVEDCTRAASDISLLGSYFDVVPAVAERIAAEIAAMVGARSAGALYVSIAERCNAVPEAFNVSSQGTSADILSAA